MDLRCYFSTNTSVLNLLMLHLYSLVEDVGGTLQFFNQPIAQNVHVPAERPQADVDRQRREAEESDFRRYAAQITVMPYETRL